MEEKFVPIELNYDEFERIYNDCQPNSESKNYLRVILQQQADGFQNASSPIFFDKDKVSKHRNDIFYLYGQLRSVHREMPFLYVVDSIRKYDDTIWTDNQTSALLLLHLGMATMASSRMAPPTRSMYLSRDLRPTLSPKDPNFPAWWELHKSEWE